MSIFLFVTIKAIIAALRCEKCFVAMAVIELLCHCWSKSQDTGWTVQAVELTTSLWDFGCLQGL